MPDYDLEIDLRLRVCFCQLVNQSFAALLVTCQCRIFQMAIDSYINYLPDNCFVVPLTSSALMIKSVLPT